VVVYWHTYCGLFAVHGCLGVFVTNQNLKSMAAFCWLMIIVSSVGCDFINSDIGGNHFSTNSAQQNVSNTATNDYHYYGDNLGMNLDRLAYWTTYNPFNDLAKLLCSNDPLTCWEKPNFGGPVPVGADGYPTQAASTHNWTPLDNGTYTVTWKGSGTVSIANKNFTFVQGANGQNSGTFQITDQNSSHLAVNVTPPISDLHIFIPNAEPGKVYRQEFLRRMSRFTTIRFMDWQTTNSTLNINWSDRSWPDGFSNAKQSGVVYEDLIAFANETGKDIYITVPHLATDDYVCRMARLFRYGEPGDKSNAPCDPAAPAKPPAGAVGLNSSSKLYVEFSNELWNWGFQQTNDLYCMTHGHPDKPDKTCNVTAPTSNIAIQALANSSLPWDNSNSYAKALQLTGLLTKRIGDIFETVFADRAVQVNTVVNIQAVWPAGTEYELAFLQNAYGTVAPVKYFAVAPYLDLAAGAPITGTTMGQKLDALFASLNLALDTELPVWLADDKTVAAKYGLPVIAYEGGQGLAGNTNMDVKLAAQDDPRMFSAMQRYFDIWGQVFGKSALFNHFSYSGPQGAWGSWGSFVSAEMVAGSQKWDGLISRITLPGDANLDGVADDEDCNILKANWQQSGKWWEEGDFNHDGQVTQADVDVYSQNALNLCTIP
jgi:hypothetical protein